MIKEKTLDIIKCPECNGLNFSQISLPVKGSGSLACEKCSQLYIIQEDILSLIKPALADISRELDFLSKHTGYLPPDSLLKRIESLRNAQQKLNNTEWVLSEKTYWDKSKYSDTHNISGYNWNRFEVRKKHIARYLLPHISGKTVVEFGGGNSGTLYHIMNPDKIGYNLICTDISYNALLNARFHHPSANFIQCNAIEPPFRDDSIDMILDFGVLHHLPNNDSVLEKHIKLLKEGGHLGLHEPTDQRPAFLSTLKWLSRLQGDQSEHNEYISERKALSLLAENGKILHQHIEYSPLRNWLIKLFVDTMKIQSRTLHYTIIALDQIIIKTLGRLWNRMDASSLLLVWEKTAWMNRSENENNLQRD
jgi:ubiquinone/menaquinone biosynthesis C-methylase UbiE/uncharacterized protein YbaR (Trm112 family)